MNYLFHIEAEAELIEAIEYYESCEIGLGIQFASEIHSVIQLILSYPHGWPKVESDIRRCQTKRFPYGVLYSIENDGIFILAVMNLHRDPVYWKNRIPS